MYINLEIMYPNDKVVPDLRQAKKSVFFVKVHLTLNRIQKYYSIWIYLYFEDFDRIRNSSISKDLKVFREKIMYRENKAKNIIHQSDPFSCDEFKVKFFEMEEIKFLMSVFFW